MPRTAYTCLYFCNLYSRYNHFCMCILCFINECIKKDMTFLVSWVKNSAGRRVGLVGGHTFYCDKGKRTSTAVWRCTRGSLCKAKFKLCNEDKYIISASLDHSHPAADYVVHNGIIHKFK